MFVALNFILAPQSRPGRKQFFQVNILGNILNTSIVLETRDTSVSFLYASGLAQYNKLSLMLPDCQLDSNQHLFCVCFINLTI